MAGSIAAALLSAFVALAAAHGTPASAGHSSAIPHPIPSELAPSLQYHFQRRTNGRGETGSLKLHDYDPNRAKFPSGLLRTMRGEWVALFVTNLFDLDF
jgi:hypothetical protein